MAKFSAGLHSLHAERDPWYSEDVKQVHRIEKLPKEVGVLLIVAGIGGLLLPGPVGSPLLVLGGVVLWPRVFHRVEACFLRRFPKLHHQSVLQVTRFLEDLERRYPLNESG
jgi:hypothetical protein